MLDVATLAQWERWLAKHHADTDEGVWLRLHKKGLAPPRVTLTYPDAVLGALCWGWIDGQAKPYDETSRIQRFTPRRKRSVWSKLNVERVERLIAEGRMQPSGLAAIDAAKADGRWASAYDTSAAVMPEDFLVALEDRPAAKAFFETLSKSARFPIVFQLQTAVKPETRERRLLKLLDKLDRGEKP